jgi:murein DD-endopeptidase MepM/ murein hydrolase activator NlpD
MMRQIRGQDSQGAGYYGAPRGSRKHQGIDFITEKDEFINSFCNGIVTKIGFPYDPNKHPEKGHLRYVEVTDDNGLQVRVFYCKPILRVGDRVIEGLSIIGQSQDLTVVYPGITQHLHFEVKKGKEFLNPMQYLKLEK